MDWNLNDIINATGGKCESNDFTINQFCIDSRKVKKGDCFIALKTDNADGHDYIKSAVEAGASAVIVSKDCNATIPQIIVDDTMIALTNIGIYARNKLTGKVIGITGSVGKTSTKDTLSNALSIYGKTYATLGNLNNHLGVPLTLAHAPIDADYIIVEMGMSALGEINDLTNIAKPDIAMVISVESNHLEFFDSINQIGQAKAEIFNGLNENGIAIYNNSTNCTNILKSNIKTNNIITYGEDDIKQINYNNDLQETKLNIQGTELNVEISGLGKHRILNTLAVLNVLNALKLDINKSLPAIKDTNPTAGRGLAEVVGGINLFDESYNASPASMKSALEVLGLTKTSGRKIAIIGDMLELGKDSAQLHKGLLNAITDNKIELVFACGENMKHLYDTLPNEIKGDWKENSSMLSPQVIKSLQQNDTVMVKGSLGSNMKQIINDIKKQD
ncbi:MAG: UDP-N-acetylmuramoyl-tripeptide--D-alanyl-D-alanine ligase [Alphaproteobacteria bacterium]